MREVYELTPRILRKVLRPVSSGIAKRGTGQSSQEVCPWNSFATDTAEEAFLPRAGVDGDALIELMGLSQEEFSRRFRGSAVKRTKRRGLLRSVAVALGNWGSPEAVPALTAALADEEPLVRGHAAWALGRIGTAEAEQALRGREERRTPGCAKRSPSHSGADEGAHTGFTPPHVPSARRSGRSAGIRASEGAHPGRNTTGTPMLERRRWSRVCM